MIVQNSAKPIFEKLAPGTALDPGQCDCIVWAVSTVALFVIGILGAHQILSSAVVGGSFLAFTLLPGVLVLSRSKNPGAWSIFITIVIPLVAGLGGASLSGKISHMAISGVAIGTTAFELCLFSGFISKKL